MSINVDPLRLLPHWRAMSQPLAVSIVAQALDAAARSDDVVMVKRLRRLLPATCKVNGFHSLQKVPLNLLSSGRNAFRIYRHAGVSIDLLIILLNFWYASCPELRGVTEAFARDEDLPVYSLSETVPELRHLPGSEWKSLCERLSSRMADFNLDAESALLMLCSVTGIVPTEAHEDLEEISMDNQLDPDWHLLLAPWESLDPQDARWDDVSPFTALLKALAEKRIAVRRVNRDALAAAITDLRALVEQEELKIFQIPATAWSATDVSEADSASCQADVTRLSQALEEYRAQEREPKPKTLAEKNEKREREEALEALITSLGASLDGRLGSGPAQDTDPTPKPKPVHPDDRPADPVHERDVADPAAEEGEIRLEPEETDAAPTAVVVPDQEEFDGAVPEGNVFAAGESEDEDQNEPAVEANQREEVGRTEAVPPLGKITPFSPPEKHLHSGDQPTQDRIWDLIARDDLAGAYWVARAREQQRLPDESPSWLLRAAQSARWAVPGLASQEETVPQRTDPDHAAAFLALAGALRPILITPGAGPLLEWLQTPNGCQPLHDFLDAVRDFAYQNVTLRPSDLRDVEAGEARHAARTAARDAACGWWRKAENSPHTLRLSRDVWRKIRDQHFRPAFTAICANQVEDVAAVHRLLKAFADSGGIHNQIQQTMAGMFGKQAKRITGADLAKMADEMREGTQHARHWLQFADTGGEDRNGWREQVIVRLRGHLEASWPAACTFLSDWVSEHDGPSGAAALCLQRAMAQIIREVVPGIPGADNALGPAVPEPARLLARHHADEGSEAGLRRRLLWLSELALHDDLQPQPEDYPQMEEYLVSANANGRSLRQALELWMEKPDFRFVEPILDLLQEAPSDAQEEMDRQVRLHREDAEGRFEEERQDTEAAIKGALHDGVITDDDYSRLSEEVLSLQSDAAELGAYNFAAGLWRLEAIRDGLAREREARAKSLAARWRQLEPISESRYGMSKEWAPLRSGIEIALQEGDTRLIDELLSRLQEAIDGNGDLHGMQRLPNGTGRGDALAALGRFLKVEPELLAGLDQRPNGQEMRLDLQAFDKEIRAGKTVCGITYGGTPPKRLENAAQAIRAWQALKLAGPSPLKKNDIETLLRFLGLDPRPEKNGESIQTPPPSRVGRDVVVLRAHVSAGGAARPIPQFGSSAPMPLEIVCLWDRPQGGTVSARLEQMATTPAPLVLYFGRLPRSRRLALRDAMRNTGKSPAVLDELLLLFLAAEHDNRLPAFLRCVLPFVDLQPYTPNKPGDVPEEMFYGRREAIDELEDPAGSCIVYGGRQLGKSALLQHVRRRFHHPEEHRYACVMDIKSLGTPPKAYEQPEEVWRLLREQFVKWNLIKNTTAESPDTIIRQIQDAFEHDPQLHVLCQLDETDNFLDADSEGEIFLQTDRLRQLMYNTGRRFKVVVSGLHQVQRYSSAPNQPLAHFGGAIQVGPLEPHAAQELVREPVEALGYRIDDNDVLRILSYTNNHPGLIQKFCFELLARMGRRRRGDPPYTIERTDIEAVYADDDVRDFIRNRFNLTLALDPRYQALAWTMVVEQMSRRDSYSQSFSEEDLLGQARVYWEVGFTDWTASDVRGLLEELIGLGVVVRSRDGYRLRGPNIVRLMGSERAIENDLIKLSDRRLETTRDGQSLRRPLDGHDCRPTRFSPLTYSQERQVAGTQAGLALLFGSDALGLRQVADSLHAATRSSIREMPAHTHTPKDIRDWLMAAPKEADGQERLIVFQRIETDSVGDGSLLERARVATETCVRLQNARQSRWLRVLYILHPKALSAWMGGNAQARLEVESDADAIISLNRWNKMTIWRYLDDREMNRTDDLARDLMSSTGGWPVLLDFAFDDLRNRDVDWRYDPTILNAALAAPGSQLRRSLIETTGLPDLPAAAHLLSLIRKVEGGPVDSILELALENPPPDQTWDEATCRTALGSLRRLACLRENQGDPHGVGRTEISVEPVLAKALDAEAEA